MVPSFVKNLRLWLTDAIKVFHFVLVVKYSLNLLLVDLTAWTFIKDLLEHINRVRSCNLSLILDAKQHCAPKHFAFFF